MAKAKEEAALVAKEEAALQSAADFDFGDDAGEGMGLRAEEIILPVLKVLQALSPEVQEDGSDLKPGMIYNALTEEAFDGTEGVEFVPAMIERTFVEWVPKGRGGGFVAAHSPDSEIVRAAIEGSDNGIYGVLSTDYALAKDDPKFPYAGNQLIETYTLYGVLVNHDGCPELCAMHLTSTKIKPLKRIRMRLEQFRTPRGQQPPLFAHTLRITTKTERSKNDEPYKAIVFTPAVEGSVAKSLIGPSDPRFLAAKSVRQLVLDGLARVEHVAEEAPARGDAPPADTSEEVPF